MPIIKALNVTIDNIKNNNASDVKSILLILLLNYCAFFIGNIIYTLDTLLILKVCISELAFIVLYTFVDKGNIRYGTTYTIFGAILIFHFALPVYSFLFYSKAVQVLSISIATISIILNSLIVRGLISKGFKHLFSSRFSTTMATIVEVSCFSYLLHIGVIGVVLTLIVRAVYITIIPKIIIKNS